jgi:hypothetical protein
VDADLLVQQSVERFLDPRCELDVGEGILRRHGGKKVVQLPVQMFCTGFRGRKVCKRVHGAVVVALQHRVHGNRQTDDGFFWNGLVFKEDVDTVFGVQLRNGADGGIRVSAAEGEQDVGDVARPDVVASVLKDGNADVPALGTGGVDGSVEQLAVLGDDEGVADCVRGLVRHGGHC